MRMWAEGKELGGVITAPFLVKLGPDLPAEEPDIILVSKGKLGRLKETYLDGPPDLVVEETSPESLPRDRDERFIEYERGDVKEYWLVDPFTPSLNSSKRPQPSVCTRWPRSCLTMWRYIGE